MTCSSCLNANEETTSATSHLRRPIPRAGSSVSERLLWTLSFRGLSMRQLGMAGGVSASLVSTFMRREKMGLRPDIGLRTLEGMARAAGVSLAWLCTGEGLPVPLRSVELSEPEGATSKAGV